MPNFLMLTVSRGHAGFFGSSELIERQELTAVAQPQCLESLGDANVQDEQSWPNRFK
jgi:hypothetical protein